MYGAQIMARKKEVMGLTDNQPGAEESKRNLAKNNLSSLPEQILRDLELTGGELLSYLKDSFGIDGSVKEVVWKLESGKSETFVEVNLSYEQVKNDTFVDFEVNGRDQEFLNGNNVSDLSTMDYQQFYPAIACKAGDKINILDGSRRRAYFLLQEGAIEFFTVLVAKNDVSVSDAKALAKELQTAKEHNLYEIGKRCEFYKQTGLKKQDEIAAAMGISRTKVVRAMQAAAIDRAIYRLFDDINELSVRDYADLHKLSTQLEKRDDKANIISEVERGSVDVVIGSLKDLITEKKPKQDKAKVIHLVEFEDKNKHAKKKTKGRNISYEFNQLTNHEQKVLDEAINRALEELYSNA